MHCPNCPDATLHPTMTRQGVEVDVCPECGGTWFDRGELFHFAKNGKAVFRRLDTALKSLTPGTRPSPRGGAAMSRTTFGGVAGMEYCRASGGLWFDKDALEAVLGADHSLSLDVDERAGVVPAPPAGAAGGGQGRPGLLALPNLVLRSTATLGGLYGLLLVILLVAVEFQGADVTIAVAICVVAIALQFLIGPFIMDLSLRWLYRIRWIPADDLPPHLKEFSERVCAEHGIRFPRFGIIDDGAPQAFTYGHTPNNARIVISRGILELLEPAEVESVVAHEIGHAVNWDMLLMTAAQVVPLILYYVYRSLIRAAGSRSNKKGTAGTVVLAAAAYVLYILAEYVVLWFSRTREFHADRFSGTATGNPSLLAQALAKIAYGLAGGEGARAEEDAEKAKSRDGNLDAVGAMGIFDAGAARSLAVASYSPSAAASGTVDKDNLRAAMRWDLWNPWAGWFELNSTHPLVAKRLRHLSNQAQHMGREPYIVFDDAQPESYWDEFLVDLAISLLPLLALVLTPLFMWGVAGVPASSNLSISTTLITLAFAMVVRVFFAYAGDFFPDMSVSALLKKVKVSGMRPVPCTVKGTIIGRGVPGYIFSEDFVMRDDTGIIFLDYRQPLAIWELLFGLLKAKTYQGKDVVIEGWYRRAPVPYVEIKTITMAGVTRRSWVHLTYKVTPVIIAALGAAGLAGLIDFPALFS